MSQQAELISGGVSNLNPAISAEKQGRLNQRLKIFALGALLPALLLIVWQIMGDAGYISPLLFPTPLRIGAAAVTLASSGELLSNLKISIVRVAAGFVIGGGLGLAFGVFVGLYRKTEKALDPTVQMIRMVPHLAIAPLFILWFGIGETAKILLIAKGAFFPLYINTFLGIRNVDNKLFDVTRVLGYSKLKTIVQLVLPAALPNILLGVRLSLGVAWLGLVVAEIMGSTAGIGYLMSDARQFSKTPIVFVGIIIFALFGKLTDSLVRLLERRWLSWRDSYKGS
ncbi:ABC transporter permease [Paenibacillus thalictri]|uniref:ABC transporter permease n=1 Tax=Paenibacillus thalictri TaxID=2527873 RepID=A0A4Q9DNU6_9BACL|nr:ABC transporter permease [Paenibacillus thalictri]TBL75272.1 ABC transporter permease [Paenibacillus thalictri]